MKKILLVHNTYKYLGGEDIAVTKEIEFLKKHYQVETLIFENSIQNIFYTFFSFINNKNYKSIRLLKIKLNDFNPDFVYVHNTWFKASVGVIDILLKKKIPLFIKLHNFRYFCTKSFYSLNHVNKDSECGACGMSDREMGIFNKYFTNSYLKSLFVIRYGVNYFKLIKNKDLKLLVLTNFHKKFLINQGFKDKNVFVMRNNVGQNLPEALDNKEKIITYAGRISREKGVEEIISAFIKSNLADFELNIIGDGPLKNYLNTKHLNKNINFYGELPNNETLNIINKSMAVVTGTKLFEGQPTLLCEASYLNSVSIFPKIGGIEEFFPKNYELAYEKGNEEDLISKFNMLTDLGFISATAKQNYNHITNLLDEKELEDKFYLITNAK